MNIYILNEDETIELVEDETLYTVDKVGQYEITLDYYYNVEGDLEAFETNNPTAIKATLPVSDMNFATEKKLRAWAEYNDFLKLKTRERIDNEVGDIYDLIADIDKRLWMNERLLMRLANDILNEYNIQDNPRLMWYKDMLWQYIYMVDNWLIVGRNDLEDLATMFEELINKTNITSSIVKEEYLDKKI